MVSNDVAVLDVVNVWVWKWFGKVSWCGVGTWVGNSLDVYSRWEHHG